MDIDVMSLRDIDSQLEQLFYIEELRKEQSSMQYLSQEWLELENLLNQEGVF